jgi:transketolase
VGGRLNGMPGYRVYVLLGDGECQEGQIWEAAMYAAHLKADRLTAIVDYNKYQESGPISRELALEPFAAKWRAFGWHVEEVDGHDIGALIQVLEGVQKVEGQPSVIIAHTVKGKGVSFVEADYTFHGKALTPEQAEKAREEILCSE